MKKDKMEVPTGDVTFSFQLGLVRDSVTMDASLLTLKTLKDVACEFIIRKVSVFTLYYHNLLKTMIVPYMKPSPSPNFCT